jgi:hypothetical protein
MEDFNALAVALGAGIADVRACLILSSDGLVLGAHPATAEVDARPARIKLAAIGEPERGFLQFGTEVWCYVRRGPYAALAVTGTAIRPGLVMDQMEQVLLAAEESRAHREGLRMDAAAAAPAPTSKPRTPLHPEPRGVEEPVILRAEPVPVVERAAAAPADLRPAEPAAPGPPPAGAAEPEPVATEASTPPETPAPAPAGRSWSEAEEGGDVDRFSLAREFSRLLQDDQDPADG